jgi:hypothetical protein
MLSALAEPSFIAVLARRLQIAPRAVSQHLSVLLDAQHGRRSGSVALGATRRTAS